MDNDELQKKIEDLFTQPVSSPENKSLLATVRQRLGEGILRVAEPVEPLSAAGTRTWRVNIWVKKAILLMARLGEMQKVKGPQPDSYGVELDTLPWLYTSPAMCRMPLGSNLRDGAYLSPGVTCMPPSVLQIGCHIGSGTTVDSMVSIGVGAQIGSGVHLSCRATIGGWIAPLDDLPTIIEDGALLGTGTGVYDGTQIGAKAVLLAGTQILSSLGIYDLGTESMLPRIKGEPLRVPEGAIVAMGSRPVGTSGMHIQLPIIVGKRQGSHAKDWEMYTDLQLTL